MSDQTQKPTFNGQSQDPELSDVLNLYKRDAMMSTNCHAMGSVINFNSYDIALTPPRPTVTVQINYPRTVFYQDTRGIFSPQIKKYQLLVSVPVILLTGGGAINGAGGASLTFPIKPGDTCLVLFNDRSIDQWKNGTGGPNTSLESSRVHDLSDGFAIVGFPSFPSTNNGNLPEYDMVRALLQSGSAQVGVNGTNNKVLITNDPKQINNLFSILQTLIQGILGMTAGGYTMVDTSTQLGTALKELQKLLE